MECGAIRSTLKIEGPQAEKFIRTFVDRLDKSYGSFAPERVVDICISSAYKYRDANTNLSTMLGPKACEAAMTTKRGYKYYQDQWLSGFSNLRRGDLIEMAKDTSVHPLAKFIYITAEEITKAMHFNTQEGFGICQISTTGWAPKSKACQACEYAVRCIELTEKRSPELYRLRKEDWDESH